MSKMTRASIDNQYLLNDFFPELINLGKEQQEKLIKLTKTKLEDIVLLYHTTQTQSSWDDIQCAIRLYELGEKKHFMLPIRVVFNKVVKLIYLTIQNKDKREEFCRKEFMKMAQLFYNNSKNTKEKKFYEDNFNDFNTLGYTITSKIVSPDMVQMLIKVFPNELDDMKFFYSDLSEMAHGNVLFNFRPNFYEKTGFALLGRLTMELVKLNDWHLNGGNYSKGMLDYLEKFNALQ